MHKFVLIGDQRLRRDTVITDEIKEMPWIWTAATRTVSNLVLPHTGRGNPSRYFFEYYIRRLEEHERLIRKPDYASIDVNPWHYTCELPKLFRQETIDEVPQDLASIPPEAQFGEGADESTLMDLTDALYEVYKLKPFKTWAEYQVAMKDVFAGVLPRDQLNVLSRVGLTLKGEPKYVV